MTVNSTAPIIVQLQATLLRQALERLAPRNEWAYRAGSKRTEFDAIIEKACSRHSVDPALVKGLIKAESAFNANAVSAAGAKGLMQLMDATAKELGVTDVFDPEQNIEAGVRYLSNLLAKYKDVTLALAAYNAGPGAVDRWGGIPPLAETQAYVPRVLAYKDEFTSGSSWEA